MSYSSAFEEVEQTAASDEADQEAKSPAEKEPCVTRSVVQALAPHDPCRAGHARTNQRVKLLLNGGLRVTTDAFDALDRGADTGGLREKYGILRIDKTDYVSGK
jgi:hypothetical protein